MFPTDVQQVWGFAYEAPATLGQMASLQDLGNLTDPNLSGRKLAARMKHWFISIVVLCFSGGCNPDH